MKKLLLLILIAGTVFCCLSCNGKKKTDEEGFTMANSEEFIQTTTWNEDMMKAYLRPYWYSREIYNETVVFVGEESEATLIYTPTEVDSVRNYGLDINYEEGVDYIIEGNKIRRLKGSKMPYWEVDDYFLKVPNVSGVTIGTYASRLEFEFEEPRYLRYGEGDMFTSKQIAITYRHNETYDGPIPVQQADKLTSFLQKAENKETVNIMIYGDSVGVGCNASGTIYGGNVSPYMPDYANILKQFLEKMGVTVNLENQAVGGWKVQDCINAYQSKIANKEIDLLILRIGGNDGDSNETKYLFEMNKLLNSFFKDYPNANVILQTPELPNQQSLWTLNLDKIEGWTYSVMEEHASFNQIAIAPIQSITNWVESRGKRTRDWLANNINHGNDFIIRLYSQVILTTMFGSDYIEVL